MNSIGMGSEEPAGLEFLPPALVACILTKLDVASIFSAASTCKTLNGYACQVLSFLSEFDLLEIALPIDLLKPMLPCNTFLRSLRLDCGSLTDSAIPYIIRPSLRELCLHNCADFSGKLLSQIGIHCRELRSLFLGSIAEKKGRPIHFSDLEKLLDGCSSLENLALMFDISMLTRRKIAQIWALISTQLTSLEIGYISSITVTELLTSSAVLKQAPKRNHASSLLGLQKLSLSVDYITDGMITTISNNLLSLTHLDLRDAPLIEPRATLDLTDSGFHQINLHGKLKHLSLVRSQEFFVTYFKRVDDLGILLMADRCADLESISLGGFCRITDTGIRALLHSCSNLYKLKISHIPQLTDLVFHDISATSLSLSHVSLRWCGLLTNSAVLCLSRNEDLTVLDLRACRDIGDDSLRAICNLRMLKTLMLDWSDVSDEGLVYLGKVVMGSLESLSLRGCRRVTDGGIASIFNRADKSEVRELDLSNLPNLSDEGVLMLARCHAPIAKLRMRQCPMIGDTSVMALASMQVDEHSGHGSSLHLLDLYNCGGVTPLAFKWLKKPYFPKLRWLGLSGGMNMGLVEALRRSRRFLRVECNGEEVGSDKWDNYTGLHSVDHEELGELERWLLEAEGFEMEDE